MVWIGGCGAYGDGVATIAGSDHEVSGDRSSGGESASGGDTASVAGSGGAAGDTGAVGGSGGSGGTAELRTDLSCDVEATGCDGDVVGTWAAVDCPLELSGEVDVTGLGLGCQRGIVTAGYLEVSGALSIDEAGNVLDRTTTRGAEELELPPACLDVAIAPGTCESLARPFMGVYGFATMECVDVADGGCRCSGTFEQSGGLAIVGSQPVRSGTYTTEDRALTLTDGSNQATYDSCVTDEAMVLIPPSPSDLGDVTGRVVLQRQ